ncbi:unnamed protein product [Acanthoscelides obtectus]|uniref:Uncharacterized protein n=1 Tax=Acanthoscelides obtectus TaxID=200917 RepID=A0A9P0KD77_ACAOB|nr:unnamed protein product [Acanthoscelides obtectus]CAK1635706.1 hypothetical protein AOBTE_LOCUS9452 [Acanthoscelides obtectus]
MVIISQSVLIANKTEYLKEPMTIYILHQNVLHLQSNQLGLHINLLDYNCCNYNRCSIFSFVPEERKYN